MTFPGVATFLSLVAAGALALLTIAAVTAQRAFGSGPMHPTQSSQRWPCWAEHDRASPRVA